MNKFQYHTTLLRYSTYVHLVSQYLRVINSLFERNKNYWNIFSEPGFLSKVYKKFFNSAKFSPLTLKTAGYNLNAQCTEVSLNVWFVFHFLQSFTFFSCFFCLFLITRYLKLKNRNLSVSVNFQFLTVNWKITSFHLNISERFSFIWK